MIHPLDYLQEIGLANSEALLYLTGLEFGRCGVAQLVLETGIKRPTAYHALNQLVDKGLADETKEGKELRYVMRPAKELDVYIKDRMSSFARSASQLSEIADLFPKMRAIPKAGAPVRQFVGAEEIKRAIDIALYCSSHRWDILAPKDNFIAKQDKSYISYFKSTRRTQGISSRTLWEAKSDKDLLLGDIISRKPRYLPRRYANSFTGIMILFDEKVLFIGLEEAVLVQTKEIYKLNSLMFDSLWQAAEKP